MGPIATAVYDALRNDAGLGAVLTGGVYDRTLDRYGTPAAFDEVGRQLPAAVVRDPGEDADGSGVRAAFAGFPQVWFQAEATDAGRAAVETAWGLAYALIPRRVAGPNGTGATLAVAGRVAVDDDPAIPGVVVGMMRLAASGLWGA